MKKISKIGWKRLALAGSLAVLPAVALAHGPSRQKIVETVDIDAPCAKVWAKIGNFQDMSWLPPVAKTEGQGGNEKGATRTLTLKNGGVIEESLEKYDGEAMIVLLPHQSRRCEGAARDQLFVLAEPEAGRGREMHR